MQHTQHTAPGALFDANEASDRKTGLEQIRNKRNRRKKRTQQPQRTGQLRGLGSMQLGLQLMD